MQTETNAAGTKKVKGRKNAMGGFYVDAIDGALMGRAISELKIELPGVDEDSSDEQIALALALFFKKTTKKDNQVRCDACNAISSDAPEMTFKVDGADACPFCGDVGDAQTQASAKDESESAPDVSVDDEGDEEEEDEEDEEEDEETDEDDEEEEETEEEEAKDAPPPAKEEPAKAATKETTMTTETTMNGSGKAKTSASKKGAASKPTKAEKSAAMVPASPANIIVKAPELDAAVAEVKRLQREMIDGTKSNARAYWHFGKKLLEIVDKQLFKLRKTGDGKPAHKSFSQFCLMEFGMTEGHAYAAIDCAKEYASPEDVLALGQTKAVMLLKAVPEDRPAIAEKIRAGASLREVREEVSKSRAKKGSPKKDKQQSSAGKKASAAKKETASARPEKITVASIEGSRKIKAYKKPESLRGVVLSEQPRAKRLADVPTGIMEMGNGVYQIIALLTDDAGNCFFKVDIRRGEV